MSCFKTFFQDGSIFVLCAASFVGCGGGNLNFPQAAFEQSSGTGAGAPAAPSSLAPVVALPSSAISFLAGSSAVLLDNAAAVTDADSTDFDTGSLMIGITANADADDRLDIRSFGTGVGQISVSGTDVLYEGAVIGSYAGAAAGNQPLVVNLNALATPASVQALVRAVTYQNVNGADPTNLSRVISVVLEDGDGATSSTAVQTVHVHDPFPSLLAHWQFDEAPSAVSALDSSSFGNTATLFNLAASDWIGDGVIGSALHLSGASSQYVSTPVNLAAASDFSFSLWLKPSAATASQPQHILWQGASGQNGWGNGLTPNAGGNEMHLSLNYFNSCVSGLNFYLGSTDPRDPSTCAERSGALAADSAPSTSAWTHVAVNVQGAGGALATVELYVDGALKATDTSDELNRSQWTGNLLLARPGAGARYYSGGLDHVRVYSRTLSAAEIVVLANEGRR